MIITITENGIVFENGNSLKRSRQNKGKSLVAFPEDFIVVDLETTGLDPDFDEIIEVSCLRVRGLSVVDSYSALVHPSFEIDEYITELTGITNEMLLEAPDIHTVLPHVHKFIGDDVVIGHNVSFDINFLYDNCSNILDVPFSNNYIDTMRLSRKMLPDLKHHRLKDISKFFDIHPKASHRALADCETTLACYCELYKMASAHGDIEAFCNSLKPQQSTVDLRNITTNNINFDESHPLYGKRCVFTGTLEKMTRAEAAQIVVDFGGICDNGITQKTNYLILGNNDYCKNIKDGKSNKQKKAEQYKANGIDIEIISENVFYDMLSYNQEPDSSQRDPSCYNLSREDEAVRIIESIVCAPISTEHRSEDYLSIITPNSVDFCRIKFGPRSSWFSLDLWCCPEAIRNDPRLSSVKNKNQRHWKTQVASPSDMKKYSDIIVSSYDNAIRD